MRAGVVLAVSEGWLTFVGTLITAFASIVVATIAARGVRRETTPSVGQRPAAYPSGTGVSETTTSSGGSTTPGLSGMDREVQGYLVRFLLFSLVASFWGAILNVALPWFEISGRLQSFAIGAIYSSIFLALGLPLLVDIYRRYGFRGRQRRH
jgi:hypothetical protein